MFFGEPLFLLLSWLALSLQLPHIQPRALPYQSRNRNTELFRCGLQPLRILFRNTDWNHPSSNLMRRFVRFTCHTTGLKCIYVLRLHQWVSVVDVWQASFRGFRFNSLKGLLGIRPNDRTDFMIYKPPLEVRGFRIEPDVLAKFDMGNEFRAILPRSLVDPRSGNSEMLS